MVGLNLLQKNAASEQEKIRLAIDN